MTRLNIRFPRGLGGYLLLVPSLLTIFLIILYPTVYSIFLSFYDYSLVRLDRVTFIGLKNYFSLLLSGSYWASIEKGLIFTFGSVVPQAILGLAIASLLNYRRLRWKTLVRGLMVLPWLVPTVTVAIVWKWMLHDIYGVINHSLVSLGIIDTSVAWLAQRQPAMLSLIVANVWRGLPLMVVMFLAGLQSIPEELYDAAKVDGATAWQSFLHVTLPWLKPVIGIAVILRIIWTYNYFDLPWVMTFGGPSDATTTQPLFAYITTFSGYRLGQGAAITVTMFLILLIFTKIYFMLYGKEEA